jgi:uncharacterized protein (TIGR00369 family)
LTVDVAALKAAGWKEGIPGRGFTAVTGPFWIRSNGTEHELGFIAEPRHSNQDATTVHGGALMTFADLCLGYSAAMALGPIHCVTAQLAIQFVAAGKVGEFISGKGEVVRRGSQLVFVRGLIKSNDRVVASADGIWKTVPARKP